MAPFEKRIIDLENAIPADEYILVRVPDENRIYEAVLDDFRGKVLRVMFVAAVQA